MILIKINECQNECSTIFWSPSKYMCSVRLLINNSSTLNLVDIFRKSSKFQQQKNEEGEENTKNGEIKNKQAIDTSLIEWLVTIHTTKKPAMYVSNCQMDAGTDSYTYMYIATFYEWDMELNSYK